jgi:hypothetical protein
LGAGLAACALHNRNRQCHKNFLRALVDLA